MGSEEWQKQLFERTSKKLRMEGKQRENQKKPPLSSPDAVQTADFVFSPFQHRAGDGDSGPLLLAKRKTDRADRYLVKHAYTDCACNEFVYTKLAQAMDYRMPDVVLFQLSPGEKRAYFKTEYILGARYLNLVDTDPDYPKIREQAKNWRQYFSFRALYAITREGDSFETPLADDGYIYRVDTTDAFPLSNCQLDFAGIGSSLGVDADAMVKKELLERDLSGILSVSTCDWWLDRLAEDYGGESAAPFLEPFERLPEISGAYIDGFLNTLCYFYPDYIGDFFKRCLTALQEQCGGYLKTKR